MSVGLRTTTSAKKIEHVQSAKEGYAILKRALVGTMSEAGFENKTENKDVNSQLGA